MLHRVNVKTRRDGFSAKRTADGGAGYFHQQTAQGTKPGESRKRQLLRLITRRISAHDSSPRHSGREDAPSASGPGGGAGVLFEKSGRCPAHGGEGAPGTQYLMLTSVALTFRIFIGMADPVPRKMISGYRLPFSMETHTRERGHFCGSKVSRHSARRGVKSRFPGGAADPTWQGLRRRGPPPLAVWASIAVWEEGQINPTALPWKEVLLVLYERKGPLRCESFTSRGGFCLASSSSHQELYRGHKQAQRGRTARRLSPEEAEPEQESRET